MREAPNLLSAINLIYLLKHGKLGCRSFLITEAHIDVRKHE